MMSRLAGRAIERTDEDYDLDDVFTSRASRKDGKAEEEREREKAIAEHQRERRWVVGCVSRMGWFNGILLRKISTFSEAAKFYGSLCDKSLDFIFIAGLWRTARGAWGRGGTRST